MDKGAGYVAALGCLGWVVLFIVASVIANGAMNHSWVALLFVVGGLIVSNRIYEWAKKR